MPGLGERTFEHGEFISGSWCGKLAVGADDGEGDGNQLEVEGLLGSQAWADQAIDHSQ